MNSKMFQNAWKVFALSLVASHATAFICLNAFDKCPTEKCTEQSTSPCKCPSTDTYCDFSVETCAGTYGNCIQIKIQTAVAFQALYTTTSYVATVSTYSQIDTDTQYTTLIQTDDVESTVFVTQVCSTRHASNEPPLTRHIQQPKQPPRRVQRGN
jgi:hypothetical protein